VNVNRSNIYSSYVTRSSNNQLVVRLFQNEVEILIVCPPSQNSVGNNFFLNGMKLLFLSQRVNFCFNIVKTALPDLHSPLYTAVTIPYQITSYWLKLAQFVNKARLYGPYLFS